MRNPILFLSLGLGALTAAAAVDPGWKHAVDQYVGAAKLEVSAYHKEIEAAPADQAPRFADAKADLGKCDRLVGQLGSSDPQHFDALKVKYEQTRARLVAEIRQAKSR
ncbi:MAG TPA: hypothetical protein VHC86_04275 [Opitutaceae bacterium]|nr:hypothetical protein [Opitutaceae bacterium]